MTTSTNRYRGGRKPGTLARGSVQERISHMAVGDALWIETSADRYAQVQREYNLPKSRRIPATKDFVIECSVWQAVSASKLCDTRILVRVERKA